MIHDLYSDTILGKHSNESINSVPVLKIYHIYNQVISIIYVKILIAKCKNEVQIIKCYLTTKFVKNALGNNKSNGTKDKAKTRQK